MNKFSIAILLFFWANVSSAQQNCMSSCSAECVRAAQQILVNCSGATPPPVTPQPSKTALYHSDSCNEGDLIVNLRSTTDCSSSVISSAPRTWGVRVRGVCSDISDEDTPKACVKFKAAGSSSATFFYHSDRCEPSELIAAVDENTDCEKLAQVETDRVWGVVSDGKCVDISDADLKVACERYKDFGMMAERSKKK